MDNKEVKFVSLFLIWVSISLVRGIFVAENYWEWKNLMTTAFTMNLPFLVYISRNQNFFSKIYMHWLKYILPGFILIVPFFIYSYGIGKYFAPFVLMLLFFTALPKTWKIISIAVILIVLFSGLDARSNVMRFIIAFAMGLFFVIPYFKNRFLKSVHFGLLFLPLILAFVSFTGLLNPFQISSYLNLDDNKYNVTANENGEMVELSLISDTRTFLYQEAVSSALKNDYLFFGRTPARGYDSESFGSLLSEDLGTGKYERFSNEVSILNVFTWFGLIGVLLYFIVFIQASYLAIYKSKNQFMRILGLFVSFRWLFAWIEDFSIFDMNYIFLWIMIGMCFSKGLREMDNKQFQEYVRSFLPYKRKAIVSLKYPNQFSV